MCDPFGTQSAANQQAAAAQQQTQLMEQQQAQHDAAVTQGKNSIDQAFAQFTPDYFNNAKQSYLDAYNPQLTDQYNIAKGSLTASLADRDILSGTPGANALGQLDKTYANEQADLGNQATDFSNSLKSNVQNTENNLYGLNASAADPLTMASQAQSSAAAIAAPTALPSLGNVFAGALQPFSSATRANQSGMYPSYLPFSQAPDQSQATIG